MGKVCSRAGLYDGLLGRPGPCFTILVFPVTVLITLVSEYKRPRALLVLHASVGVWFMVLVTRALRGKLDSRFDHHEGYTHASSFPFGQVRKRLS